MDLWDSTGKEIRAVLTQPKRLALLAYLSLAGSDRYVRRDNLLALFWPEADQNAARHALRTSLHFLRHELGEGVVNSRGQEEVALGEAALWCDVLEFERALEEGRTADALGLYRGDLLEGFFVADASPAFEQWLDDERRRLRERAAGAAVALAEDAGREGNLPLARHWATSALSLAPHDEGGLGRLVALLLRLNDRAGALQLYETFTARLARDLELTPSAETRALAERIRESEPMPHRASFEPASAEAAAAPLPVITPSRRRILRWAVPVVAGLGVVVTVLAVRQKRIPNPPILAVGTIESRLGATDSTDPGSLRDLLATDLARVAGLQVVSEARLIELMGQLGIRQETPAARTEAARRAGARELLEGVLYRHGPELLRLDLRRVDLASGVFRGGISTEAADLFALADSATAALGRSLRLAAPADPLARVMRTSLVARRLYDEGLREYYLGDLTLALRLFRAALAEDSSFAMAGYYAALTAEWIAPESAVTFMARARQTAASLPDRERLIIEAGWARMANDPSAVAVAESLATRYPLDPDGEYAWGFALSWSGEGPAAAAHLTRAVAMDSLGLAGRNPRCRACDALEAVVNSLTWLGEGFAAESIARAWVTRQPQSARAWNALRAYLERAGRGVGALEAQRRVIELVPTAAPEYGWLQARLGIRSGTFAEVDRFLTSQVDVPHLEQEAQWWLVISLRNQDRLNEALREARRFGKQGGAGAMLSEAQVLFELGRYREAGILFDSLAASALHRNPADSVIGSLGNLARRGAWTLTHLAVARAAAGDTARLGALADSIEQLGRRSAFGRDRKLHFFVRGLLARARGRREEAVTFFRQAQSTWIGSYSRINLELGRVLLELGRPLEAQPVLRAALQWDLEANNYYVTHRELHRELGRAFRAAGMAGSARVHERWGS